MTAEEIRLAVETPTIIVTARLVEVRSGESYVTLRQVMGRTDEWTIYEPGDSSRQHGLVGKVDHAPTAPTSEELLPWAADLVTRRERARLATIALRTQVDDKPHPVKES